MYDRRERRVLGQGGDLNNKGKLGGGGSEEAMAAMGVLWSCCGLCRNVTQASRHRHWKPMRGRWLLALMTGWG